MCQLLQQLRTRPLFPLHLPPCCYTLYSTNRMFQNDFCSSHFTWHYSTSVKRLFKLFSFFLVSLFYYPPFLATSLLFENLSPTLFYFLFSLFSFISTHPFFLSFSNTSLSFSLLSYTRPAWDVWILHPFHERQGRENPKSTFYPRTRVYTVYTFTCRILIQVLSENRYPAPMN